MSADNGIYILRMKDGARVIEAQAIENLFWSPVAKQPQTEPVWFNVYGYYRNAKQFPSYGQALQEAGRLEENIRKGDWGVLEYGISTVIETGKTWGEIVQEAKSYAENNQDSLTDDLDKTVREALSQEEVHVTADGADPFQI